MEELKCPTQVTLTNRMSPAGDINPALAGPCHSWAMRSASWHCCHVMGIRSERRLCDEVHLNLAYRWFCRLGLEGNVPDHSTFYRYRHGKFRDSGLLRQVFEATVERCLK